MKPKPGSGCLMPPGQEMVWAYSTVLGPTWGI